MDAQPEIWKALSCVDCPRYDVSNLGNVRNNVTRQVLAVHIGADGYKRANVRQGPNRNKVFLVHRLVALAFLQNPGAGFIVHHVNHDRADARVVNLQWIDRRSNNLDRLSSTKEARPTEDIVDLVDEEWRQVKFEYPTNYDVYASNLGRIKFSSSVRVTRGSKTGAYLNVHVCGPNSSKCHLVHRLVASCFCANDNSDNKTIVNHLSGVTTDNRAANLQWVTPSENSQHSYERLGSTRRRRGVEQYNICGQLIASFDSVSQAARKLGLRVPNICKACTCTAKKCGGFMWRYRM